MKYKAVKMETKCNDLNLNQILVFCFIHNQIYNDKKKMWTKYGE